MLAVSCLSLVSNPLPLTVCRVAEYVAVGQERAAGHASARRAIVFCS